MTERIPCEFSLIRYVPDVVRGEFVNIGLVLREVGLREVGLREASAQPSSHADAGRNSVTRNCVTQVRFTRDWRRVRCLDPDADTGLLESFEDEIARLLIEEAAGALAQQSLPEPRALLDLLSDTLSNSVQIAEPRACLAESFALEMELLMRLYIEPVVEPARSRATREKTGRAAIHAAMRKEFERTGAWAAMFKRLPVWPYTRTGDPMKLDCGYRPNGVLRVFHAVSLASDADAARGLAHAAPLLRAGLLRNSWRGQDRLGRDRPDLDLAAVVEPLRSVSPESGDANDFTDEAADLYRFGVATLENGGIRVLTTSDLARAAETARTELRL